MRWLAAIACICIACTAQGGQSLYDRGLIHNWIVAGFTSSNRLTDVVDNSGNMLVLGTSFPNGPVCTYDGASHETVIRSISSQSGTVSWWQRYSSGYYSVSYSAYGSASPYFTIGIGNVGLVQLFIQSSVWGGDLVVSPELVTPTAWHHYCVSSSGSAYKLYVDGKRVAASTTGAAANDGTWFGDVAATHITLGALPRTTLTYMTGQLADVKIYERELSEIEVMLLAKTIPSGVTP